MEYRAGFLPERRRGCIAQRHAATRDVAELPGVVPAPSRPLFRRDLRRALVHQLLAVPFRREIGAAAAAAAVFG